jgi:bacteriorhodopsin
MNMTSAVNSLPLPLLLVHLLARRDCWRSAAAAAQPSGWQGFSLQEAAQGWCSYLYYSLPCVAMVCLEWWVWEVSGGLCGVLL